VSRRGGPRPVRNLAAWGYESSSSGDRLEVDVWTVNDREADDDLPDPEDFGVGLADVLARAGDIAKVEYAGAAGVGYRRISTDEKVSQQAFAGAARSAGGSRTDAGTFGEGAEPAVIGPDLARVIREGREEVIPPVEREFRELAEKLTRDENRDEDEEEVADRPFDGFDNEVRVILSTGDAYRYEVRNGAVIRTGVRRSR